MMIMAVNNFDSRAKLAVKVAYPTIVLHNYILLLRSDPGHLASETNSHSSRTVEER